MLAEGKNPVFEAIKSGTQIERILVLDKISDSEIREQIKRAKEKKIRVEFVQKQALDRISQTGHHQGIIAIVADYNYYDLDQVLASLRGKNQRKTFILLDGVEDPHNLGSIIRSAECLGFSGVIIPSRHSALVNETVIRTSAGAINYVKVIKVANLNDAIKQLKNENIFVYSADMDGQDIRKTNLSGDVAVVVGSEGFGVSSLARKLSDQIIKIPMTGNVNSMNASVSAGICMYEVMMQGK